MTRKCRSCSKTIIGAPLQHDRKAQRAAAHAEIALLPCRRNGPACASGPTRPAVCMVGRRVGKVVRAWAAAAAMHRLAFFKPAGMHIGRLQAPSLTQTCPERCLAPQPSMARRPNGHKCG